jgi:predicted  nucleic acid-binding Zn-ribbon protein
VTAKGSTAAKTARVDPEALPFDQYQRYRLVSDLLEEVRGKKQRFQILDVGGRTGLLRAFLPDDDVALVDLEPSTEPGLVLGDGSKLPFRDKCFDVVAAFDTLEHVPPRARAAFVAECARVAKSWVFLAGPYQSPAVDEAEMLLQRFLQDKLKVEHRYLEEHRHNGLPSLAETEKILEQSGALVAHVGHGNLERWLALMCMAMYLDYEPRLRPLATRLFRFYNAALYASDHAAPVYRHAVIAAFGGAKLPKGQAALEAPVAPRGALERFREVTDEIVSFDRAREDWREERARLAQILATLERDLAGHRAALDEERARAAEQVEVIGTLQTDLEGHRATVKSALADLASERELGARVRAELEADLEMHRATLATLEREIEAHRAQQTALVNEIDQHKARAADVEADLAGHRAALDEARRILAEQAVALEEQSRAIATLEGVVSDRENQIAQLAEIRAALEKDLEGHKASLQALQKEARDLRAEYAATIARYEKRVAEHLAVEKEMEARLEEHRSALADVRSDLEGHRSLARDLRGEIEAARAEQARLQDELDRAQQDIAGKRSEIATAAEMLRRNDRLIGELRADLKNRWKSVKRAFGPKRPTPGER